MLRPGEHHHRCDYRWHVTTAGGELVSEGPRVMFFKFPNEEARTKIRRTLWQRGIHCLSYPGCVLVVSIPYVAGCEECDQGAAYVPGSE